MPNTTPTFDTLSGPRLILVTGPSGAGRSTAVRVLEDLGYEAIDNMPLSLLPRLLAGPPLGQSMVLGIDVRNRDFSTNALIEAIDRMGDIQSVPLEVLYLDCRADVLVQRYSETRRRHPLAAADTPQDGIGRELELMQPIRARADFLIDTSDLTVHELKSELEQWFFTPGAQSLAVSVHSFSYKRGLPRGIDMLFDTRFLRNPHWDAALRSLNGTDAQVQAFVAADPRYEAFFAKVTDLVDMLLPAYIAEGKAHFSIGFGCTGGQHRSVTLTEQLAKTLAQRGWQVSIRHRELERRHATAGG